MKVGTGEATAVECTGHINSTGQKLTYIMMTLIYQKRLCLVYSDFKRQLYTLYGLYIIKTDIEMAKIL